ncbi:mediator of RNA polymerase II transcription subunit 28-like [Coccinella septempunctata]|uniref:mediator of RNA polymerase II transcription subunit 28-like n=1 Tax=Coccinella septempunctata TaxID=41139 RepID=UPI001D069B87|nr:mediator of RNA polymerase II transcription subunit 28-like [Coccinella septempunctata]
MKETSPPVSAMATPTNGSVNLVDEFEETFQYCLNILTKEEAVSVAEKEEIKVEVEHNTFRFIDLARQMEAFFLQKRFLLSSLKPETIIKEDISELRLELARKEEILKKHAEKIAVWQNLLSDLKNYNKTSTQGATVPSGNSGNISPIKMSNSKPISGMVMPSAVQMLQQQEQFQHQMHQQQMQQLQQQQLQMQQHMQVPMGMQSGVSQGMVSPEVLLMQQSGMQSPRLPFSQAGPGRVMQGPLAYLEKTTSNIGLTDGRR